MLKIKIEETETGKALEFEGKFVMFTIFAGGYPTSGAWGSVRNKELVPCLISQDDFRANLLNEDPTLRLIYDNRQSLFTHSGSLDMTEALMRVAEYRRKNSESPERPNDMMLENI